MSLKRRDDIDGLRAVAVVAVVLYHADVWPFTGGYVGVDIFFVISGFLITSIIVQDAANARFSFADFYLRRIRRILPALLVVVGASFAAGFLILLPYDLEDLSKSIVWTMLFNSNILFLSQTDYFDAPAAGKPLLHTWSLSIEEQFYLFWPLVIVGAYRFRKSPLAVTLVLGGLSLLASLVTMEFSQDFAFYFAPLRSWELLTGAALAAGLAAGKPSRRLGEFLAFAGAAMIAWCVFFYTPDTKFPGATAILPCLGAALILYAGTGEGSLVTRLLSSRIMVGIGLISYSLYLWHWPILVFHEAYVGRPSSATETASLVALAFALAGLTWALVEQPFRRRGSFLYRPRILVPLTASVAMMLISGSVAIDIARGFPGRFSDEVRRFADGAVDQNFDNRATCFNRPIEDVVDGKLCAFGPKQDFRPDFLVWGDSHALALLPAFQRNASDFDNTGWFAALAGCRPLLGNSGNLDCDRFNQAVAELVDRKNIPFVVLVAEWPVEGNFRFVGFEKRFRETVDWLTDRGVNLWIVEGAPKVPVTSPPAALAQAAFRNRSFHELESATKQASFEKLTTSAVFDRVDATYPLDRIKLVNALCDDRICQVEDNGRSLYRDDNHLSQTGALFIAPTLNPLFIAMERAESRLH